jgi:hypothetical protein
MNYSGDHKVSYLALPGAASGDPTDALAAGYPWTGQPRLGNRSRFIWLSVALTLIVFVIVTKVTMLASVQPLLPSFAIASVTVASVSRSTEVRSGNFSVTLAVFNPNTKVDVRFDTIVATVYYDSTAIAEAALPPMYQEALAERFVAATAPHVGSDVVRGVRRDMSSGRRGGDDVIWFRVEAACRLAFHQVNGAEVARTRWRNVMIRCGDLPVRLDNTTVPLTSGKLVGPVRPCTVK